LATKSIANLNSFKVLDPSSQKTYYGCDQAWYKTEWQRRAGCGPTAASNIFLYLGHALSNRELRPSGNSKQHCMALMEEVWRYVTPTERGIPSTKMLYEDMRNYTQSKGLPLNYAVCDVPVEKANRPDLTEIIKFLESALVQDAPVAFLNLCNGHEKNLDRWHWVTIVSMEYTDNIDRAFIDILDEGLIKKVDLRLWYNTTTLGGGFVYFTAAK
jgi:hypothetical protein